MQASILAFILGLWIGPVSSLFGQSPEVERAIREARRLEAQGKLAEAAQAWQQFVARHPEDLSGWSNLGVVLARQGRLDEAVGAYKKALELDPRLPEVQLNLGLAYFKSGALQSALGGRCERPSHCSPAMCRPELCSV